MTLAYPYGPVRADALFKAGPQDFRVSEELGFEPSGQGEHLFLYIEKIGLSTVELVSRIAAAYSLSPRLIGFSGQKDKQAITRQWLSLHLPGKAPVKSIRQGDGFRILRQQRHVSKLKRGTHKFNHFQLLLRQVNGFDADCKAQIELIRQSGMANYFGRQRFGRREDNVQQALRLLNTTRLKRARRSMLISSLRSELFNRILARRICRDQWLQPLPGDLFMLRGSHSIFNEAIDDVILQRFKAMDISSSASLYGSGVSRLSAAALQLEQQVFSEQSDLVDCLDQQQVKIQMRAMRVAVDDLELVYDKGRGQLELSLSLPTGSYVSSLLDHFIEVREPD